MNNIAKHKNAILNEYTNGIGVQLLSEKYGVCKKNIRRELLSAGINLWHTNSYKEALFLKIFSPNLTIAGLYNKIKVVAPQPASKDLIRRFLKKHKLQTIDYHRIGFDAVVVIKDSISKGMCIEDISKKYKICTKRITDIIHANSIPYDFTIGRGRGWGYGPTREAYIKHCAGKECTFYTIKCTDGKESFYKTGITSAPLWQRFAGCRMPYKYVPVVILKADAATVWDLEQETIKKLAKYQYKPTRYFAGWTECFTTFFRGQGW